MALLHCNLKSLTLSAATKYRLSAQSIAAIAGLTALTRLELVSYGAPENAEQLHGLAVSELVLKYCQDWEAALFVPGSLTALRRLHIEDALSLKYRYCWEGELNLAELISEGWLKIWDVLLKLPQLSKLSGCCKLFEAGLAESSRSWQDRACPELPFEVTDVVWKRR